SLSDPGRLRARADRGMRALVVLADELPDGPVETRKVQHRHGMWVSRGEAPGQGREQFGVDGVEEPLDLSSSLWAGDRGVDDTDLQRDRGVLEVMAGEVAAVVDVEDVWDAAHRPGGVALRPDGLAQRQRGVHRGGCALEDHVPADRPRVVVHDRGQPGPGWSPAGVLDEDVEL